MHVDIISDFGTRVADSDDIGGRVLKGIHRKARRQTFVVHRAHHRKRRSGVDECIANQHSVGHSFREQLRHANSSRCHSITRRRLRFCRLCYLLATARRAGTIKMLNATTCVASTRRFFFSGARRWDVAKFATLEQIVEFETGFEL